MPRQTIKGKQALRRRLRAVASETFKPAGRDWAEDTARLARARVPQRTGRLRQSIRRKNASKKRATVVAHYTAYFVDAGTKPHDIRAKKAPYLVFPGPSGRTIFARKVRHRGYRARPFRRQAALEALQRADMARAAIEAWNRAG